MIKFAEPVRKTMLIACAGTILLVIAGVAGLMFWVWPLKDDSSDAIWRVATAAGDGQLRLADAVPGKWDHVYVFPPYARRSSVCQTLGVAQDECERVIAFESNDDGAMSLAFVDAGRVVRYVGHSRANGDFVAAAHARPVARAQAVYRIVSGAPAYNGRRALALLPAGQP